LKEHHDFQEKQREEAKRERMYDPVLRWQHLQETITWPSKHAATSAP